MTDDRPFDPDEYRVELLVGQEDVLYHLQVFGMIYGYAWAMREKGK